MKFKIARETPHERPLQETFLHFAAETGAWLLFMKDAVEDLSVCLI